MLFNRNQYLTSEYLIYTTKWYCTVRFLKQTPPLPDITPVDNNNPELVVKMKCERSGWGAELSIQLKGRSLWRERSPKGSEDFQEFCLPDMLLLHLLSVEKVPRQTTDKNWLRLLLWKHEGSLITAARSQTTEWTQRVYRREKVKLCSCFTKKNERTVLTAQYGTDRVAVKVTGIELFE